MLFLRRQKRHSKIAAAKSWRSSRTRQTTSALSTMRRQPESCYRRRVWQNNCQFFPALSSCSRHLDLANQPVDLSAKGIDVATRLGALPDSSMVAVQLGRMERYLCAASAYLERRGAPQLPEDISGHDTVERLSSDRRPRQWRFSKQDKTVIVDPKPRISVNEILTIHRLVLGGAGLGIIFDHAFHSTHWSLTKRPTLAGVDNAAARNQRRFPQQKDHFAYHQSVC